MTTVVFQIQSLLIVLLMLYGVTQAKKNRLKHQKIMITGIVWDLLLILQIEVARSAIEKAASVMEKSYQPLFYIHLFFAISTVLLYPLVVYSGWNLINNKSNHTFKHRLIGAITLTLRICTLFTSYYVVAARG